MITSVTVDNLDSAITPLVFDMTDETADYIIKNIDGLGPVDASIKLTGYSDMPGAAFQSAKVGSRNPLFKIGFGPDYAVSDPIGTLRRATYKHLAPGSRVKFTFARDVGPTVYTIGYVEKLEPDIFTDEPMLALSVICPDPYFYANTPVVDTKTLGSYGSGTTWNINNAGDVACGFHVFIDDVIVQAGQDLRIIQSDGVTTTTMHYSPGGWVRSVVDLETSRGQKMLRYMGYYEYHNWDPLDHNQPYTGPRYGWVNGLGYVNAWAQLALGANTIQFGLYQDATSAAIEDPMPGSIITVTHIPKYAGL